MKIYNTLTGKKEPFIPHTDGEVKIYVCGPTVYNLLHVGNMRCYVVFDTVRRFLEHRNYKVTMVQNFTDVDDKIIAQAQTEGVSAAAVAEKYINEAKTDYKTLNICPAENYPQVTQEIPAIIEMITELISAGYAYERAEHVFFATEKFADYGKLSKKNVADLIAGARVAVNEDKNSPVDFVLWKPAKDGEPFWESPWGKGRPGWHIECSAMARKYLGQVDIHGGGEDLIFPHHENEIAQSEALTNTPFAKYWLHNGALTSGHKKMSKSLGNFFTFREVAEKFSPEVIRFFLLSG
ncbi:MAG: cysteine--tRNA ligase, partial [Defluviitaleaceae bacterium]|nr:cysteine--tRNA ligase [Defluviitaleaceae bacterium]